MRNIVVPIVVGAWLCSAAQVLAATQTQQASAGPLEGTRWSVKVTPDDVAKAKGEKPFDDALIFARSAVTMSACVKMGFQPSAYTVSKSGEAWSFQTKQISPKEGTT